MSARIVGSMYVVWGSSVVAPDTFGLMPIGGSDTAPEADADVGQARPPTRLSSDPRRPAGVLAPSARLAP